MKPRFYWLVFLMIAMTARAAAPAAQALHAFLDRSQAALGDTVTLNIEGADAASGTPDLSPLQRDFDVLGTSSSSKLEIVNGVSHASMQLGIALRPKHAGTLMIPSLRIGNRETQPLTLQVSAAPQGAMGTASDPVFLEDSVDAVSPYVGQQVVYTLKLFYAGNLTGGQLEEPQADGAQMIHLNSDTRYQTERNGRTWQVVERHYALVPQHAGRIVVRGPSFAGQMLSSNRSDPLGAFFDDGSPVQARAADVVLVARAPPLNAGTPWLPAQSVQLQLSGIPRDGRIKAGEPLTLTLGIDAVGIGAAQLPEPELPPLPGARVYPDQSRDATRDDGQHLHSKRTRSFAIVPERNGTLTIPAITLNWWNVTSDQPAQARLPAHTLMVGGAAVGSTPPPTSTTTTISANATGATETGGHEGAAASVWRDIAMASLALWLLALTAFVWWRFARNVPPGDKGDPPAESVAASSGAGLRKRALEAASRGDAGACERALLEWACNERSDLRNLGVLREALADPAQREALERLQRARWKDGDLRAACAAVASAFSGGFAWHEPPAATRHVRNELPPLYPQGR